MILRHELVLLASLLTVPVWPAETRSSESSRPRGVGPDFAKFYRDHSTFTCISNPSITIPFEKVNDDYCDCPDGSDEPGTAACSYLSHLSPYQYPPSFDPSLNSTLALPGFYCKNKGHIPAYIRFEYVNDGRCDYQTCCDGSDEYSAIGGIKCPDKCAEIGKEYRKQEEVRNKSLANAMKKKKAMVADAETALRAVETKIKELEVKIESENVKLQGAKQNLVEVENKERLRVVQGGSGKTGKTGVLLGLAKGRVQELRSALEKTKKLRDAMFDRIAELESVLGALKEERNPNFNDEGVKRAVRAWEDYAARDTDDHWSEAEDRDLAEIMREDGAESGINWAEFEGFEDEPDDVQALYQFTNYLPVPLRAWIDDKLAALRQTLVDNGILAPAGGSANVAETKAVQDARKTVTDSENALRQFENDLNGAKDDLKKDYGPESIFRALKDKCISTDSGEYTYELCFLGDIKQKSKKSWSETSLGGFESFEVEYLDEDLPLDGKGLGTGDRLVMNHKNGQKCWDGPNRSTKVILGCSENEEIWKVSESERCVYRMEVGTSAVCGWKQSNGSAEGSSSKSPQKDEL